MNKLLAIPVGCIVVAITLAAFPAISSTVATIVSCGSTAACVTGSNTSTGPGVQGNSRMGSGVYGSSLTAVGVKGKTSAAAPGVYGVSSGSPGDIHTAGVYGNSSNVGVGGGSANIGVQGAGGYYGVSGVGRYGVVGNGSYDGVIGENQSDTAGTAVLAQGNTLIGFLFRGSNSNGFDAFTVDDSGNIYARGQVSATKFVTHTAPAVAQATSTGAKVTTFSSQSTAPSVEHIGEANMIGGAAMVRFNPNFAATLARAPYMVVLTPQGPTQGSLYVSQKSPGGFVVRESQGGRSTVAFDYRVVGRPYSSQLNTSTDTLQGHVPAGPIHGPAMQPRLKLPGDLPHNNKLLKPQNSAPYSRW